MKEFHFVGCFEIRELLGEKATDERKLLELIEEVPIDSVYYHTHSYFLRHFYIAGPYPNDFANWAAIQVRDRVLGEKLGAVTPWQNKTLEDIRSELIDTIDNHLSSIKIVPSVVYGRPFHFMKSRIIEIPLGLSADHFEGFVYIIKTVDASSIYNLIFEARLRNKRGRSDFSIWLDEVFGRKDVAEGIEKIDCYMYSLEGLRGKLLSLCT